MSDIDHNLMEDSHDTMSDPASTAYGQWSWQPGWTLPTQLPSPNGNPGWVPPFHGYAQYNRSSQQFHPSGELERIMEAAVQRTVHVALSSRDETKPTDHTHMPLNPLAATATPMVTGAASTTLTMLGSTSGTTALMLTSAINTPMMASQLTGNVGVCDQHPYNGQSTRR